MRPRLRWRMAEATRCSRSSVPVMLVSMTCRAPAKGLSRKPCPRPWPALAISRSTGRPPTACISWSMPDDVDRSTCTASTLTLPDARSAAAASSSGPWSAAMTRSWPSCAASCASSRPMPVDAPVTMASGRGGLIDAMGVSWMRAASAGGEDDLAAVLLLLLEDLVAARGVGQRQGVGDDGLGMQLALGDVLQQLRHVVLRVSLAALDRQTLLEHVAQQEA